MRGFGFTFDIERGVSRSWVSGPDGIKKWADTGELVPDERRPYDDNEGEDNE